MKSFTTKLYSISMSTIGLLIVLLFWKMFSLNLNSLILPSPQQTWEAMVGIIKSGVLFSNLLITLKRTLIGYTLAIFTGFILAILLKTSRSLYLLFKPMITIIQTIPPVIWLALSITWFGIADDLTPIFLIFVVTLPVIFINIFSGLESINYDLIEMAQVYKFSRGQVILHVYLPSIVPHFVAAINIGLAFAWKSTVFAEYLGSSNGIGFALSVANSNLETDELFAWAIVLVFLMLFFEYVILQPVQAYVTRWYTYGE